MQKAVIRGFAHQTQSELNAPYMRRYFDEVADVWERRTSELAQAVVVGMFPSWHATIADETVAAADEFLADNDIPSALRRLILEGRSDVVRALRAREVDAAAS
jgi:aminopeptidase N